MAKETESISTVDFNKTCSDGESRENERGYSALQSDGRIYSMQPIYHGYGPENLGIWLGIVEIEGQGTELEKEEDWNMNKEE